MKTAGLAVLTILLVVMAIYVINRSIKSHTPPPPDPKMMEMLQKGSGTMPPNMPPKPAK
jgi:hypothetical protein